MYNRNRKFLNRFKVWPWSGRGRIYSIPRNSRFKASRAIVLILVLVILWWFSLDVLYMLHKQSAFKEIGNVVMKHEDRREIGGGVRKYTLPQHGRHARFNIPAPLLRSAEPTQIIDNNVVQPLLLPSSINHIVTMSLELYPDLVVSGLGYQGKPAALPAGLESESARRFSEHSFDSVLSDRISLNRKLKDYRGNM